ncbi:MAG: hypothetical protein J6Z01_02995 [Bacteroidales bacterium]|nr:hypothetical protein [Bacteroidales bacterium]
MTIPEKYAKVICALIIVGAAITYLHMLSPTDRYGTKKSYSLLDNEYRFEMQYNDVLMTFAYVGKENDPALEIEDIGYIDNRQNLIIPDYIEKDSVTYKVLSVTEENSVDCDTLFIPATVEFFDSDKILDKCRADVNYIIVEPGNKYYKSVDGNLYRGDSLVFDVKAVYHNQNTY